MPAPQMQKPAVERMPALMLGPIEFAPVKPGRFEGRRGIRIRNSAASRRIVELRKAREFVSPSFGDGFG
jgi:hypothetical protein